MYMAEFGWNIEHGYLFTCGFALNFFILVIFHGVSEKKRR